MGRKACVANIPSPRRLGRLKVLLEELLTDRNCPIVLWCMRWTTFHRGKESPPACADGGGGSNPPSRTGMAGP